MYLGRLKKYDPTLKFAVTLTEERAVAQAKQADAEIGRGQVSRTSARAAVGAKDLLAVKGTGRRGSGRFETR